MLNQPAGLRVHDLAPLPSFGGRTRDVNTVGSYHRAATTAGVWAHQLAPAVVPGVPVAEVVNGIAALSVRTGVPLTGYARTRGGFVSSLLLVRDPSVTHGVPKRHDCERAAAELAAGGDWRSDGQVIRSAVLVALGLREGYDPGARVHTLAEFKRRLARGCSVWTGMPAELISARPMPGGDVQLYHEPGVLTFAAEEGLPALAMVAHDFGQRRFVVHDWLADRTTAFSLSAG
ncbi:hypothetical protein AB0M80_32405 [Amycolatopsis sp. NPDC051045]|uniref:hypothetical protein n=1 Tax=Amycolatopsis sp. NPDC051045 TaxID=3156922 RepID=UPI00342A0CAD